MARKKSYDLPESDPVSEDASGGGRWPTAEATMTVRRHMEKDGAPADWHDVVVKGTAEVNPDNASEYQNLTVESEEVPGIKLNATEEETMLQALGVEPVEDEMSEEEHEAALAEETEEEPEEA